MTPWARLVCAATSVATILAAAAGCEGESGPAAGSEAPFAELRSGEALGVRVENGRFAFRWAGAPLTLETVEARGLALSPPAVSVSDGRLTIDRGALTEEIEPVPAGVEQRWWVPEAPPGREPLSVRVRAEGLTPIVDEGGIALADGAKPWAKLRYGKATWIDAEGRESPVEQSVDGDAIVLTVPRDVLANTVYPAVLDPFVSPEIVAGGSTSWARPEVAVIGSTYLVVWKQGQDLVARRLSPAGVPLDATPLVVIQGQNIWVWRVAVVNQTFVVVARDDTALLHVRGILPDGTFAGPDNYTAIPGPGAVVLAQTYFLQVASNGSSYVALADYWGNSDSGLDPSGEFRGVRIFRGTETGSPASLYYSPVGSWDQALGVGSNGTDYLVLYQQSGVGNRRNAYSGAGALLSSGTATCVGPAITWTGSQYMAVFPSGGDLAGCTMDAAGVQVGGTFTVTSAPGTQDNPRSVFDGANTFLAWNDNRTGNDDVYANWLTPAGAVQFPGDFVVAGTGDGEYVGGPAAAAPGSVALGVLRSSNATVRFITNQPGALGAPCNGAQACQSGFCVDGVCCDTACGNGSAGDCTACSVAAGAAANGTCGPVSAGFACDDGTACTTGDACVNGACAGSPVVCAAPTPCHAAGVCDPVSGQCAFANLADGTSCDDGQACTTGDACTNGACAGSAVVCAPPTACHAAGVCNPASGQCDYAPLANGTSCDDGDPCTNNNVCTNGVCTGTAVTCPSPPACHTAGACNPATGQCDYPSLPNGTPCSDGAACTTGDVCASGTCGGSPVACAPPTPCHSAGVCNPATGQCDYAPLANGTSCDDGNACTTADACTNGACAGSAVGCAPPPDPCHAAGICNPGSGQCDYAPLADGSPCAGGTCTAGVCVPNEPDGGAGAGGGTGGVGGMTSTGGTSTTGGVGGTTSTGGVGGTSTGGVGGMTSTGGTISTGGVGGTTNTAGGGTSTETGSDTGDPGLTVVGCACRTSGSRDETSLGGLLATLALLVTGGARRRRTRPSSHAQKTVQRCPVAVAVSRCRCRRRRRRRTSWYERAEGAVERCSERASLPPP